MQKRMRLGAVSLLAALGGLAAMVAGAGGHYHADYATPKKKRGRARLGRGTYGASLMAHFAEKNLERMREKAARKNRIMPKGELRKAA